ncbi:hypothetical protein [Kiloniella laminariae]|uniref:hypothetical protein n=1 Tax=Kiloniella laminariae TaxID=454162 RepID=UPI0012F9580B|nr:hypothetical protein [Kiloniella laminariae]
MPRDTGPWCGAGGVCAGGVRACAELIFLSIAAYSGNARRAHIDALPGDPPLTHGCVG